MCEQVFSGATVERVQMAKALQDVGLTLDEIVDALHSHDTSRRCRLAPGQ